MARGRRVGPRQPHVHRHEAGLGRETGRQQHERHRRRGRPRIEGAHQVEVHPAGLDGQDREPEKQKHEAQLGQGGVPQGGLPDLRTIPVIGQHQDRRSERHQLPQEQERDGVTGRRDELHRRAGRPATMPRRSATRPGPRHSRSRRRRPPRPPRPRRTMKNPPSGLGSSPTSPRGREVGRSTRPSPPGQNQHSGDDTGHSDRRRHHPGRRRTRARAAPTGRRARRPVPARAARPARARPHSPSGHLAQRLDDRLRLRRAAGDLQVDVHRVSCRAGDSVAVARTHRSCARSRRPQ